MVVIVSFVVFVVPPFPLFVAFVVFCFVGNVCFLQLRLAKGETPGRWGVGTSLYMSLGVPPLELALQRVYRENPKTIGGKR